MIDSIMVSTQEIPLWLSCTIAFLVVSGALLTLLGNIGLLTLKNFYARVHSPTMGVTLGIGNVLISAILFFSVVEGQPYFFPILITVFVTITTPVTLTLLARAALYRDRTEGSKEMPKDE